MPPEPVVNHLAAQHWAELTPCSSLILYYICVAYTFIVVPDDQKNGGPRSFPC